jgi:FecR protein/Putative zinc-finger
MNDKQFDQLLSAIRNEEVSEAVVDQAGDRVWKSITGDAHPSVQPLRSCADFQALIPGYLAKQLTGPKALLFEDHVHSCVACRHAIERRRGAEVQPVLRFEPRSASWSGWRWAMSAAAVAAVALVTFGFLNGLLPGQHSVRAEVQTVGGSLYAADGDTARLIPAGYEIRNGDEIRTAKGSTAVVRLLDGSLVEMGERASLSVSRRWKGTTIDLQGGQVIVQAAKQRSGHLYVATDDGLVSVKGTVFSVNHGLKGSRVAVIEGVVHVDFAGNSTDLNPGEQATSGPAVSKVPIQNEIAWSRNSAKYLALLGEFSILQKQFAAIPGPGLRYNSDLLPLIPENAVVYAAIPNLANTIGEATRLFDDRLQQSPELRTWWRQQQKGNGPKLDDVLNDFKTFSSYLGDEVVFAIAKQGTSYTAPIILARVRQPGLEDFIRSESSRFNSNGAKTSLQIVHDPGSAVAGPGHPLLVYVENGLLIATPEPLELRRAAQRSASANSAQETPFTQHIASSYQQGVEWLFCADMEQILQKDVQGSSNRHDLPPGMGDVRYLTLEHRELDGKPESRADLMFASQRQGIASWLAAPASMGSLDFVSPNASMVTSAVIKNPRSIMEEIFKMIGAGDANFSQSLTEFESKTGISVLDDIAAPLGGEVTMAFDGPMIPTPRWKLIFEVYDPTTLQSTIEKMVDAFNREGAAKGHSLQLTKKQINSRTYYVITNPGNKFNAEVDYTFVDSYLIAAPDTATISRAIQSREAGYTLPNSSTFKALVPTDSYTNFSAIFYHNLGPVVGPLADQVKSSGVVTPQQRQSIDFLTANTAPGLIYAYGEPNSIVVASNTGFMGFDLGTLLTMGHNGPFTPQMFLGGMENHATAPIQ